MDELGRFTTERLEAELADRWSRRRGAPSLEECQRLVVGVSDLMRGDGREVLLLAVPLRADTPALLRATADELEVPPEHALLRRVHFRDVLDGRPWTPGGGQ